MQLLSALFGLLLIMIGAWLFPVDIMDISAAKTPASTIFKAGVTLLFFRFGTLRFVHALS